MQINSLEPKILQGGMGVYVSDWKLARTVSRLGQLGIISGTGLGGVLTRLLQNGDKDGTLRQAFDAFPIPEMAQMIWGRYFIEGGKSPDTPFRSIPVIGHEPNKFVQALLIVANFVEVWRAKHGHDGLVGMNYLEKLQTPHLYSFFGAILAGVDVIVAGAGLPIYFPRALERLSSFEEATYDLGVVNGAPIPMKFDPSTVMTAQDFLALETRQPACFGIVSTSAAAKILHKKSDEQFDGFVVEGPKAGGHNAPPRRSHDLNERGEPIYDMADKDNPHLEEIREIGLPFWLAGSQCSPKALQNALTLGARGVQVGTAFSLCRESGLPSRTKLDSISEIQAGTYDVLTDPVASSSGMPFKVVQRKGTISQQSVYEARPRLCDLGSLRHPYLKEDGTLGWRCPAEPVEDYVRKGGEADHTIGRKCVCNGLLSTIGYGQVRQNGWVEPALITSGDDTSFLQHLELGSDGLYGAKQVVDYILSPAPVV